MCTRQTLTSLTVIIGIFIAACTGQSQPQAAQVIPTQVQLPSVTPTEGPSPIPTQTPLPTLPPTIEPTMLPSLTPLPPCDLASWWDEADPLVVRFLDIAEVASATSRVSLSGVLLELRVTFREFERLEYPDCAEAIYSQFVSGMEYTVDGFNYFLGESEGTAEIYLSLANERFWIANDLLIRNDSSISSDLRLTYTYFIWGGDEPNALTATWVVLPPDHRIATVDAEIILTATQQSIDDSTGTSVAITHQFESSATQAAIDMTSTSAVITHQFESSATQAAINMKSTLHAPTQIALTAEYLSDRFVWELSVELQRHSFVQIANVLYEPNTRISVVARVNRGNNTARSADIILDFLQSRFQSLGVDILPIPISITLNELGEPQTRYDYDSATEDWQVTQLGS